MCLCTLNGFVGVQLLWVEFLLVVYVVSALLLTFVVTLFYFLCLKALWLVGF